MDWIAVGSVAVSTAVFVVGVPAAWQYWTWERRGLWRAERNAKALALLEGGSEAALALEADSRAIGLRLAASRKYPTTRKTAALHLAHWFVLVSSLFGAIAALTSRETRAILEYPDYVIMAFVPLFAASTLFMEDGMRRTWRLRREWIAAGGIEPEPEPAPDAEQDERAATG
ncbi:hypothetical protein ACFVKB_34925 [Rhodococcus sp. NPDC127530]|uniref:hypothetical protein n=1 Tax=unclassified Rhodococcus (in: high G+C Gram-positive bacteria) TaxID=192944 RepID=UPI003638DB44